MHTLRSSKVLVLDFGAQYAQLIARRVREHHVFSEIVPSSITSEQIEAIAPRAIILSGGPKSVNVEGAPRIDERIYSLGIPILGICYGAQLISHDLGGVVSKRASGEYGKVNLEVINRQLLLEDVPEKSVVWMSHFDAVTELPPNFQLLASTPEAPCAAFADPTAKIYALQFHPEVEHSEYGYRVFDNFLHKIVGAEPSWTNYSIIEDSINRIRSQVGNSHVICALSGGVDSSVAAALVHRAIGDQLHCVYVDTGLMRHGESKTVEATFREQFEIDLLSIDASDKFFSHLEGVTDPEAKRKIIGEDFIRTFEAAAKDISGAKFLVQGTLYPDVIESGTKSAARIKSHHNVGGLPEDMDFELVEPLRELFKDEVRAIGEELGLPEAIVWRQPFPGPGLAVRIVGEVTRERVEIVRAADRIVGEEVLRADLDKKALWQSFAVLADIRSVGVMGDERSYAYPIILRAVESSDAMTADWARLPYELLERISSRIVAEVQGVNRVVYDITSKPPATIEWE
ncbi:glutamine-hydrolyzing GMP synthase [Acidithrix ferrooxidans]|uniref:GMP synthase [glutamine-hydrolyzing] n=1 Tax=Acidithrix ferrooxidans TaxID=1280514 RepID=A0A0D8HEE5_9ACTN|nr:glutamine-hydrolyzing GMP synthase [Acidithrix ferrooxidans]KJF16259.1 GMP synthase [Acidithrix ferrooxidans]